MQDLWLKSTIKIPLCDGWQLKCFLALRNHYKRGRNNWGWYAHPQTQLWSVCKEWAPCIQKSYSSHELIAISTLDIWMQTFYWQSKYLCIKISIKFSFMPIKAKIYGRWRFKSRKLIEISTLDEIPNLTLLSLWSIPFWVKRSAKGEFPFMPLFPYFWSHEPNLLLLIK